MDGKLINKSSFELEDGSTSEYYPLSNLDEICNLSEISIYRLESHFSAEISLERKTNGHRCPANQGDNQGIPTGPHTLQGGGGRGF